MSSNLAERAINFRPLQNTSCKGLFFFFRTAPIGFFCLLPSNFAGYAARNFLPGQLPLFSAVCLSPHCAPGLLPRHFQFETLRVSNHTACRFAEKTRLFRSLWAGRRCAAASRLTFFNVETLYVGSNTTSGFACLATQTVFSPVFRTSLLFLSLTTI
ncbi:MAG TPA: hypothetical protein H9857_01310 [Candidatus Desulfovibrio intestinigallinarum]|nr:hypothetical protein [Candidatus Desulfovibrio intestinigallinarum]